MLKYHEKQYSVFGAQYSEEIQTPNAEYRTPIIKGIVSPYLCLPVVKSRNSSSEVKMQKTPGAFNPIFTHFDQNQDLDKENEVSNPLKFIIQIASMAD